MKNNSQRISVVLLISLILQVVAIAAILFLVYRVNTLTQKTTELNTQALQFNARTNNLKGCLQNNDRQCPENKYFDSNQYTKNGQ
ncbi:MAG: hypothetical protein WAQ22_00635 [Candidatus Saccharimonas sp.]